MKKLILILAAIGLAWFAFSQFTTQNTKIQSTIVDSRLAIGKNNIDIGEIKMSKGKVEIPFKFKNTGEKPVQIVAGETSCMCTSASFAVLDGKSETFGMRGHGGKKFITKTIAPGETSNLTAIFDPNAHGPDATGPITRSIFLTTNSSATKTLRFDFRGNVIK